MRCAVDVWLFVFVVVLSVLHSAVQPRQALVVGSCSLVDVDVVLKQVSKCLLILNLDPTSAVRTLLSLTTTAYAILVLQPTTYTTGDHFTMPSTSHIPSEIKKPGRQSLYP